LEEEDENNLNESSLRGNDIENMIKRRITQSSKIYKRLSCDGNESRKQKKSSKTILSGQNIQESYEKGDLFVKENKIDIEGNFETRGNKTLFAPQENYLEQEKEFFNRLTFPKSVDLIKEKEADVFNSVEYEPKSRSNSNYFLLNPIKNLNLILYLKKSNNSFFSLNNKLSTKNIF